MPELEQARKFLNWLVSKANASFDPGSSQLFDTTALYGLHSLEVSDGKVTCKLPVRPRVQNRFGTLHGGCMATLVDVVGSAALRTKLDNTGVSLHIATNYMSPMPSGQDVIVTATIAKLGKTVATVNVDLQRSDGTLVAQGTHIKFIHANAPPDEASRHQAEINQSKL